MKEDTELNKLVSNITKWLDLKTLDTQHNGEDFHELAVWQIKEIIEESYNRGVATSSEFSYDVTIS